MKSSKKLGELGDGVCIPLKSGPERLVKGRLEGEERPLQEDVQPLVLREAPVEGVVGLITPPCPPSSPATPSGPRESSSSLPSVTAAKKGDSSSLPSFITSKFVENGLQRIVLHSGGSWGISILACKV